MGSITCEPRISISVREGCINVGRGVIRALGSPAYVRVLRNAKGDSLAIQPCVPKDVMSFKVPEHFLDGKSTKLRITSTSFCRDVFAHNGLDETKTYTVPGRLRDDFNAVIFDISEARNVQEKQQ